MVMEHVKLDKLKQRNWGINPKTGRKRDPMVLELEKMRERSFDCSGGTVFG